MKRNGEDGMRTKIFISFICFLFVFCVSNVSASIVNSTTVQNIAAKYRLTVVEIQTSIKNSSGDTVETMGAGFFIDREGHILTAAHVVYDDEDGTVDELREPNQDKGKDENRRGKTYKYQVIFNGKKYSAHFVGSNRYVDTAIIKLDKLPSDEFLPAVLGNSDEVKVGEFVVVVGNPIGLTNSVSSGIISALHRRDYELWFIEDFIQTDAPINPGNSGGPLINMRGEVIGINDATVRSMDGLGFSVPINMASEYLERMKKEGDLKITPLGVNVLLKNFPRSSGFDDIKKISELLDWNDMVDLIMVAEISKTNSALVMEVKSNSPAQKAGLKIGDIIVKFNGYPVNDTFDLRVALLKTGAGKDAIPVEVVRVSEGRRNAMIFRIKAENHPKKTDEFHD